MEDDDLAQFGEMEDIAHYADVLESTCDHEGECALGWSQMIMADAVLYWTDADETWLDLKMDHIWAIRRLEALQKPGYPALTFSAIGGVVVSLVSAVFTGNLHVLPKSVQFSLVAFFIASGAISFITTIVAGVCWMEDL